MALTRETKAELLASYQSEMAGVPHAFLVDSPASRWGRSDDLRRRCEQPAAATRWSRTGSPSSLSRTAALALSRSIWQGDGDRVQRGRSGRVGQDADGVREGRTGDRIQGRHGGRPKGVGRRDSGDRQSAEPGGSGGEAPVPAPVADCAVGAGFGRRDAAVPPHPERDCKSEGKGLTAALAIDVWNRGAGPAPLNRKGIQGNGSSSSGTDQADRRDDRPRSEHAGQGARRALRCVGGGGGYGGRGRGRRRGRRGRRTDRGSMCS